MGIRLQNLKIYVVKGVKMIRGGGLGIQVVFEQKNEQTQKQIDILPLDF
jgi:hypothetical protein